MSSEEVAGQRRASALLLAARFIKVVVFGQVSEGRAFCSLWSLSSLRSLG